MEQTDLGSRISGAGRAAIARALLEAPGWARVGLNSPKLALREDAAIELARIVEDTVGGRTSRSDGDQLGLNL